MHQKRLGTTGLSARTEIKPKEAGWMRWASVIHKSAGEVQR